MAKTGCVSISVQRFVTRQDTRAARCTSLVRVVLIVIQTERGRLVFVNQYRKDVSSCGWH
jgi:hypothetical protein